MKKGRFGKSPCFGCTDRFIYCHDSCDKYLAWKNKGLDAKQSRYEKDGQIIGYVTCKTRKGC